MPCAINLVSTGKVSFERLVTGRFPLSRAAEAFAHQADVESGSIKTLIDVL
jgi:threonine dehydrogenase-like Zn-dependent dehydrogenase